MPTKSYQATALATLHETLRAQQESRHDKMINGHDPFELDDMLREQITKNKIQSVLSTRYLRNRIAFRNSNCCVFERDLDAEPGCWLDDYKFKVQYAMTRESFWKLHKLIQMHQVFERKRFGRQQLPSEYQLMILLSYLRTEGNGMTNVRGRAYFGIGRGTMQKYRERSVVAILDSLRSQTIYWPDRLERKDIARNFYTSHGMPNLVGVADGTLFPLTFCPEREDWMDFNGRKLLYSLTCLIVNDDKKRIRYHHLGWPGSTHDDRVLENSWLRMSSDNPDVFSPQEYIIGDSAYMARPWLVPAYKKPAGGTMHHESEVFNEMLAKPRVNLEHTICILKCRFPFLQSIRLKLKSGNHDLQIIIQHIQVCMVLHNLLIGFDDNIDPTDHDDTLSDLDADNELNQPLPLLSASDTRRTQLKNYMLEMHHV